MSLRLEKIILSSRPNSEYIIQNNYSIGKRIIHAPIYLLHSKGHHTLYINHLLLYTHKISQPMKKSTRIFVTFVIALLSTLILFGKNTNNKYPEKIQFKPEKEIKIITVAQKVAQDIAPQFGTDTLVAVIYTAPYSMKKDVVDVHFMKHEDDHIEYHKGKRDTVNKRVIIDSAPIKRPNSILTVTI